jgi:elongation factor 1 alpha-like protein
MSKLAALAAARKKKEGDRSPASTTGTDAQSPSDAKGATLSLRERLAASKQVKQESLPSLQSLKRRSEQSQPPKKSPEPKPSVPAATGLEDSIKSVQIEDNRHQEEKEQHVNIRAPPSTFAATIVGDDIRPKMTEPSHLYTNTLDLIRIYGQDLAEPFDFSGPSPDDVILNAQSSAKGLAIRRNI